MHGRGPWPGGQRTDTAAAKEHGCLPDGERCRLPEPESAKPVHGQAGGEAVTGPARVGDGDFRGADALRRASAFGEHRAQLTQGEQDGVGFQCLRRASATAAGLASAARSRPGLSPSAVLSLPGLSVQVRSGRTAASARASARLGVTVSAPGTGRAPWGCGSQITGIRAAAISSAARSSGLRVRPLP